MYRKQRGVSMTALLLILVVIIFGAIGGMKIAPAYTEYFSVKKAVTDIATSGEARSGTVADVRKAFDRRALVDDIKVIGGQDLDVTKEGGEVVVSFAYPKQVQLFSNISLLIEFSGSSNR
jgi:hypothetical protein